MFLRVKDLAENNSSLSKHNWCLQVKNIFEIIGEVRSWNELSVPLLHENKVRWVNAYKTVLYVDELKIKNESLSLQIYPRLTFYGEPKNIYF